MKISNDIAISYGGVQEQKAESKIDGNKMASVERDDEIGQAIEIKSSMRNIGAVLPLEIRQVLEEALGKDMPLDREVIFALRNFIDKYPGSYDDKIQVIKALLGKELDINMSNLEFVYEALFGKEMSQIINPMSIGSEDISNHIGEVKSMINKGASLDKILDFIEYQMQAEDISPEAKFVLTKAVNEGRQAAAYRMDDLGERIILKAFKEVSVEKSKHSSENTLEDLSKIKVGAEEEYTSSILGAVALGGKNYLVAEITTRLKEASQSFKQFKKEAAGSLDMAVRFIKEDGAVNLHNAKANLQKTIDALDKVILKGDIALFADMKLEKELVKADSYLQKAKLLLDEGEYGKACKLADKVRNTIESMNWKPSNNRIIHYATLKEGFAESTSPEDKLKVALKGLAENFSQEDYSSRKVYEAIRLLGQDHEGETARFLAGENLKEEDLHNNIKSLLLKLSGKGNPAAELIPKICGNQLLNRTDNGTMQTMFFALPLVINENMKDIKVYINSKKDDKKMDWQNCSIYFLIDAKKLGETGILLQSSGGNLSITVKNDKDDLEARVSHLLEGFRGNLKELGYEVGNINFTRLSPKEEKKLINPGHLNIRGVNSVNPMKKGFDIKI